MKLFRGLNEYVKSLIIIFFYCYCLSFFYTIGYFVSRRSAANKMRHHSKNTGRPVAGIISPKEQKGKRLQRCFQGCIKLPSPQAVGKENQVGKTKRNGKREEEKGKRRGKKGREDG